MNLRPSDVATSVRAPKAGERALRIARSIAAPAVRAERAFDCSIVRDTRTHSMTSSLIKTLLIAGTLLGSGVALAANDHDSDRSHPKSFVKDSAITAKIKTKLMGDHFASLVKIHVDTDANGVVYLSGTARTQAAADEAVSMARATEHVTSVHSDIRVKKDD